MSSTVDFLQDGPVRGKHRLILAHGAGAPMDSPFMNAVAEGLAAQKIRVIRFEFPYMVERRISGRRKPPDRMPKLLDCWRSVVDQAGRPASLHIGGKSMGGRVASMIADELGVKGLVCMGYPFHPPGKPDRLRTEHLTGLQTEAWFGQGERDPFGTQAEVAGYGLPPSIRFHWFADGDHSWKPRKKSGFTESGHLADGVERIGAFIRRG